MPNPATHQPPDPDEIRRRRLALDLSRSELAARMLNATPHETRLIVRANTIINNLEIWESGRRAPDPAYTDLLLAALQDKESQP